MKSGVDECIIRKYVAFNIPADQIVSDPELSKHFTDEVNKELESDEQLDVARLNKRLLNLRKKGESNGGLPRLRRSYHGRN